MVRGIFAGGVVLTTGVVDTGGVGVVAIGVEVISVVEVGGVTATEVTMGLDTKPAPPDGVETTTEQALVVNV